MSPAITVDGLSKSYVISHQGDSTNALRDVLSRKINRLFDWRTTASYRETFWALRDVSFEISQGERVGLIGRNGAGKSTLLKILSRITEPTRGSVRIAGRVASLLEVGTGFHPELSGRENIYLSGAILGMGKKELRTKFDEIVAFAEIDKFLDTPVKHYSSGMYVRLGFAVAAHVNPDILIVDEVLAVGDAQFQKKCTRKMSQIGREGRTILFVSHNMSLVLQQTERSIVLANGQVNCIDSSDKAVAAYMKNGDQPQEFTNLTGDVPWLTLTGFEACNSSIAVRFNEPLLFRIILSLEQDLKDGNLTLFITNSVGARLLTSRVCLSDLPPGRHTLAFELQEHRLLPGNYFVSLVIRQGMQVLLRGTQVSALDLLLDHIDGPKSAPFLTEAGDRLGCYCPASATLLSSNT